MRGTATTPAAGSACVQDPPDPSDPSDPREPSLDDLVEDDLLVEEISIDGMCGVY